MAETTFVCFKWTGTYYNSVYNGSHVATIRDDDDTYEGQRDNDEKISVDGGAFKASQSQPYAIDVSFTDTQGNDHVENFKFFQTAGSWYFIPGPDSAFEVGAKLGSYQSHTTGWDYASAVCFADGTLIATETGTVAVEDLSPGDMIRTADGTLRPLRLNLARRLTEQDLARHPALVPVRIRAGALGQGMPRRDLWVSRQHRMLLRSGVATEMFGAPEVLVAAIRLTACPGIALDPTRRALSYHHLVFDRHEVILANGCPSESLYPGPQALKSVPFAARAELFAIFPQLGKTAPPEHARPVPENARQKALVARHIEVGEPLVARARRRRAF